MADVHSKERRSFNMSQIKAKNTKPELTVRKFLHSNGFRFRIHVKKLPGKPDLVLHKYNTIIFVHGCFWHGHKGCKNFHYPHTRKSYWIPKINSNIQKDFFYQRNLRKLGWKVITIWECELKKKKILNTLKKISDTIKN